MVEDCMYCGQDRDPCFDADQMARRGGSCADTAERLRMEEARRLALETIGRRLLNKSVEELWDIIEGRDQVRGGGYQGGEDAQQPTDGLGR